MEARLVWWALGAHGEKWSSEAKAYTTHGNVSLRQKRWDERPGGAGGGSKNGEERRFLRREWTDRSQEKNKTGIALLVAVYKEFNASAGTQQLRDVVQGLLKQLDCYLCVMGRLSTNNYLDNGEFWPYPPKKWIKVLGEFRSCSIWPLTLRSSNSGIKTNHGGDEHNHPKGSSSISPRHFCALCVFTAYIHNCETVTVAKCTSPSPWRLENSSGSCGHAIRTPPRSRSEGSCRASHSGKGACGQCSSSLRECSSHLAWEETSALKEESRRNVAEETPDDCRQDSDLIEEVFWMDGPSELMYWWWMDWLADGLIMDGWMTSWTDALN